MSIQVTCPSCDASYELVDELAGKRVRCKECKEPFLVKRGKAAARVEAEEELEEEDEDSAPPTARRRRSEDEEDEARPSRRRRDEDDDGEEGEGRPTRRRRRRARSTSAFPAGLVIGLVAGVAVLVLLVGGAVAWLLLRSRAPIVPPLAQAPAQQMPFVPPAAPPGQPAPAQPQPAAPPPAQAGAQNVVLSNPRVSRLGPRMTFMVDYEFQQGAPRIGGNYFLIIKSAQGNEYEANLFTLRSGNRGTMNVSGISVRNNDQGPFEMRLETGLPGRFGPRETISNTVTTGP